MIPLSGHPDLIPIPILNLRDGDGILDWTKQRLIVFIDGEVCASWACVGFTLSCRVLEKVQVPSTENIGSDIDMSEIGMVTLEGTSARSVGNGTNLNACISLCL